MYLEQVFNYFDEAEDKLAAERREIMNHFREERSILISLLEDNLGASKHLRCLKGMAIEKLVDSIDALECDEDEYEVGFGDDDEAEAEEDEEEDECCTGECCDGKCACEEDEKEVTEDVDATT
jgi:hypothetical protein